MLFPTMTRDVSFANGELANGELSRPGELVGPLFAGGRRTGKRTALEVEGTK